MLQIHKVLCHLDSFFFITGLRILTPFHVSTVEESGAASGTGEKSGNVGHKKRSATTTADATSSGGASFVQTAAPRIPNSST